MSTAIITVTPPAGLGRGSGPGVLAGGLGRGSGPRVWAGGPVESAAVATAVRAQINMEVGICEVSSREQHFTGHPEARGTVTTLGLFGEEVCLCLSLSLSLSLSLCISLCVCFLCVCVYVCVCM